MSAGLFSQIELRGLSLANRIVIAPLCQYSSQNGSATDWHLAHFGSYSVGAGGLVMTESTSVSPIGKATHKCATLCCDENELASKRVIDFCKQFGVAAQGLQLTHAGRQGSKQSPLMGGAPLRSDDGAWETVAPSAVPFDDNWHVPRPLSRAEISEVRLQFEQAVLRAFRIGYDLVELQMGRGELLHQFLSPISNRRTDEFGGCLTNRMRFPIEVFMAMRDVWPSEKPLGACIPVTDWVAGGWQPKDAFVLANELKRLGCDYIHIVSGGIHPQQKVPLAAGYQVPLCRAVRDEVGVKTMVGGLVSQATEANQIIVGEYSDFVCLGRSAMWDPRWAWHAAHQLGATTLYPTKAMACHPSIRPHVL